MQQIVDDVFHASALVDQGVADALRQYLEHGCLRRD
jgi:hypothetical protein